MKKHILFIDSDKSELITFLKALNQVPASFKCTYANDAVHAAELLRYLNPDYIFFDLPVENADTRRFIQAIHNKRALLGTSYFLYTRDLNPDVKRTAEEMGVSGCIPKTAVQSILIDVLAVVMGPKMASS